MDELARLGGARRSDRRRQHRDVVGTLLDQQHEQRQSSNLADQGRILLLSLPAAWLLIVEDFDQAAKSRTHNLEDTKA
jgi:hypothetical protein